MFGDNILVRTLLVPPRLPRRWLPRGRLDTLLSGIVEYPLTVVSASAGYGKSTALTSFIHRGDFPAIWCTLGEGCDDPLVFLVHLVYACRESVAPQAGEHALAILPHGGDPHLWGRALDSLVNDLVLSLSRETLLVLDDYQTIDDRADIRALIERLIAMRPPLLHLVLLARRQPQLECLPTLQVRGELLEIGEQDLAFTRDEIAQLFRIAYGVDLSPEEVPEINQQTGGWAIALQLVWQGQQANIARPALADGELSVLGTQGHEALFSYLAREVLAGQPPDIQRFLLRSSVLSELEPAACDRILGLTGAVRRLETLHRRGLFLTALGGGLYRYHPLFHAFLRERAMASLPEWDSLHLRAAEYYRETGAGEQVLHHLLAGGDTSAAAVELERWAPVWLNSGRLVTLLDWVDQLPEEVLADRPQLLIAQGDAARLLARFDTAQRAYERARVVYEARASGAAPASSAGHAQALRGQALIYLDTSQPVRAETLLRRAFRLLSPDEAAARAELLGLIAENRLSLGRADQALRIFEFSRNLDPRSHHAGGEAIHARILLHLGRLADARALLEAGLPDDRESLSLGRPSEGHREVALLLSFISALEGDAAASLRYAQEGLEAARRVGSALFEAGARICAGHALQLATPPDYQAANEHYLQAITLAGSLHIQRPQAEAYMGLALLHGFQGNVAAAEDAAREGLRIVEQIGDSWTAAQLWASLGAVGVANGVPEAHGWLDKALTLFRTSKDTYGQAVVRLWLSIEYYRAAESVQATRDATEAFDLVRRHSYGGLLTAPTLFGPRDRMMLVPVLLAACSPDLARDPASGSAAQAFLKRGFPEIAADASTRSYHPGVTLRIRTFGPLRVWRGNDEIGPHEWQRKKAQQMLALLLTNRDRWLLREQICDFLWPDEAPQEAEAQFKVTLNGLNAALEPLRPPRKPPYYIRRQGGAYRFHPPDGVWLDVAEFESQLAVARAAGAAISSAESNAPNDFSAIDTRYSALSRAVELHQGEYLGDWLYEDWARDERERLETRYMEAATQLAVALVDRNESSEAIRLCELVLARDPGWEEAYRVLMRAYSLQGQRSVALATYERCVRNLRECLDVEPLPSTVRIYEQIKAGGRRT